jgi:hypothetical protein
MKTPFTVDNKFHCTNLKQESEKMKSSSIQMYSNLQVQLILFNHGNYSNQRIVRESPKIRDIK